MFFDLPSSSYMQGEAFGKNARCRKRQLELSKPCGLWRGNMFSSSNYSRNVCFIVIYCDFAICFWFFKYTLYLYLPQAMGHPPSLWFWTRSRISIWQIRCWRRSTAPPHASNLVSIVCPCCPPSLPHNNGSRSTTALHQTVSSFFAARFLRRPEDIKIFQTQFKPSKVVCYTYYIHMFFCYLMF